MSTRSRVGIAEPDERITSIYVHFDGYVEGVGKMLHTHWTDEKKIRALMAEGDASILGSEIGEQHDFDTHSVYTGNWVLDPDCPRGKDWCLFYRRDRGEDGVDSITHPFDQWPDYGQEYEYVYVAGLWVYREPGGVWQLLAPRFPTEAQMVNALAQGLVNIAPIDPA